jgi:hypothetical protein
MNYAELEPHRARTSRCVAPAARTRDRNCEELALHLEAAYEDALADGLSEAEAESRAVQAYDWRLLECKLSRAEQPLTARALQPPLVLIERKGGM